MDMEENKNDYTTQENVSDVEVKNNMPNGDDSNDNMNTKAVIGVILIIAGLLLVLKNMNFLSHYVTRVIFSWPMLLIVIGLVLLRKPKDRTAGWIVFGVGCFFLLPYLFGDYIDIYKLFWPAIFILIGIVLITSRHGKRLKVDMSSDEYLNVSTVFGANQRRVINTIFKGGKVSSVFGATEIDLRSATLAPGTNELDITCVFGGINILAPEDWNVIIEVSPFLGGFEDSRRHFSTEAIDTSKQLKIRGVVIFGGGEVK